MRYKTFCSLPGEIKILADTHNWVLQVGNINERRYFHSLDALCDEILEIRLSISAKESKKIKSKIWKLRELVLNTRVAVRSDWNLLKEAMSKADSLRKSGDISKGGE